MGGDRYSIRTFGMELIVILIALVFLAPFYLVLVNSVKSFAELQIDAAGWPSKFVWSNYSNVWRIINFPKVFWNSVIITIVSNLLLALIAAMSAYRIVRFPGWFNTTLFTLFVAAMVIPFQSIMIPLIKVANQFRLMDSRQGLVVCYLGFGVPLTVFLYHGFIKSIPLEIEEAAVVDGCTPYSVFWRIVFPLLRPMSITVILLNSLWIWNDFLLPSLVLHSPQLRTIPLATYSFFGQYTKQWDLALAGLVLGITPIIIFFLLLQRYIIEGITAGSVKG